MSDAWPFVILMVVLAVMALFIFRLAQDETCVVTWQASSAEVVNGEVVIHETTSNCNPEGKP